MIPENVTISADLNSPIPCCHYDGHNWEQLSFNTTNTFTSLINTYQKVRLPFSPFAHSVQNYIDYSNVYLSCVFLVDSSHSIYSSGYS